MSNNDVPATRRKRVARGVTFTEPTLTKQSFAQECDINHMVACWVNNGAMPRLNTARAAYPDFSEYMDLKEASDLLSEFHDAFDSLPSDVRQRFGNDPHNMTDFLSDPNNLEEAVKMGFTFSGNSYKSKKETSSPAEQPSVKAPDTPKETPKAEPAPSTKSPSEPTV